MDNRASHKVTKAELNALEALMADMDAGPSESKRTKRRSSQSKSRRPVSTAFPGRPSSSRSSTSSRPSTSRRNSRSSSTSRLSAHSSALSIRSLASAHGSITPSMGGAEWSNVPPTAGTSTQILSNGEEDPLDPLQRTPQISTTWSSPSSPTSPFQTSRSPRSTFPGPLSPGRLEPRPARNERTPMEDFAFLNEDMSTSVPDIGMGGVSPNGGGGVRLVDDDALSSHSHSSRHSSVRSAKLRQEIEAAAHLLRLKASAEALGGKQEDVSSPTGSEFAHQRPPSLQSKNSSGSGKLHFSPPPIPSPKATTGLGMGDVDELETRSVLSAASVTSAPSTHSYNSGSLTNPSLFGYTGRDGARERERPRQRELKEWSQVCWIWQREKQSQGMLAKTPLIRDVPNVVKRKMGKRDSSQLLTPDLNFDEPKSKGSTSRNDKSAKPGFGVGPSSSNKEGSWRKVTGVMRDDGYFRIFNEDTVILHSVHLPSIPRTDVRVVDPTLFGRPNVVVIHRRQTLPPTPGFQSKSKTYPTNPLLSKTSDDPLYVCMPSIVSSQSWIVMAHCFARPEFYTSRGTLTAAVDSASNADSDEDNEEWEEVDLRCRIFRSIHLTINEGRAIGEIGTETARPPPKERRPVLERQASGSTPSVDTFPGASNGDLPSPSRSTTNTLPTARSFRNESGKDDGTPDTFCEISLEGDALARTSIRKGTTSPFWSETFVFSDLPSVTQPMTIKIFQSHKNSRPTLLGAATVRVPDLPRAELVEDWWPVKPAAYDIRGNTIVGELSLSVKVDEEIVLPSSEYAPILEMLNDDPDAELTSAIASEFPSDLEEVSKTLLRIYQAESQLIPRLLRLAEREIDGDVKSAAILFRGNSILTKSIELYLRLVGAEYLDLSIGEPIRRLCNEKIEIEIDPSKMKPGVKEKDILNNVHHLREWTMEVWNLIYSAREKCPNEVRIIFAHIQKIVADRYGDGHKKMRSTSISAFIFLRFFVPAVLNPKLFSIVPQPPDPKAQRSLTLIAKTLQGLANFSTFGQKEPWMLPMNSFVQDNTAAFVDFIDNISTPSPNARFEWTSPNSASYLAPYRLRNSLPAPIREGVPLLPHLIDLPRDLGLLASQMSRATQDRSPQTPSGAPGIDSRPNNISRANKSAKLNEFAERCLDVREEARRRGGGLVTPLHIRLKDENGTSSSGVSMTSSPGRLRPRAATHRGAGSGWSIASNSTSASVPDMPPQTPPKKQSLEELHIRARSPQTTESSSTVINTIGATPSSAASRRSHRSFTISGIPPRRGSLPAPPSMSVEDLGLPVSSEDEVPELDEDDVFSPRRLDFLDHSADEGDVEVGTPKSPFLRPKGDYIFPSRPGASSSPTQNSAIKVVRETSTTVGVLPSLPLATSSPSVGGVQFQHPFSPSAAAAASVEMSHAPSQGSMNSVGTTGTSATCSTVSSTAEVSVAHVVPTGRKPSTAGAIFSHGHGHGQGSVVTAATTSAVSVASATSTGGSSGGEEGEGRKRGLLARMGRKNSTVAHPSQK